MSTPDELDPRAKDALKAAKPGKRVLADLVRNPRNPNVMTPEAFEGLKESIRQNGFLQPILVAGSLIVDGHHRTDALLALGYTETIVWALPMDTPMEVVNILSLGMNRLRGFVSLDAAESLLRELVDDGASEEALVATGFSDSDIASIFEDADPEPTSLSSGARADDAILPEKPHVLELRFATAEEKKQAARGLRKASGKSKDIGQGLLLLLSTQRKTSTKTKVAHAEEERPAGAPAEQLPGEGAGDDGAQRVPARATRRRRARDDGAGGL